MRGQKKELAFAMVNAGHVFRETRAAVALQIDL